MKGKGFRFSVLIALFALSASAAWAGNAKVQVCHIPPGNPSNFHTITISESALSAHLGHGDLAGACFANCDTLCSDGNACTIDACDASENCISTHPPVNCNDSNLCTTDSCNPATGCANTPKICTDGDNCTVNACDPVTGSCVAPPVVCPAGQTCDPANGNCRINIDECLSEPCLNNGECVDGDNRYTCQCLPGFTGDNCENEIDECESNPCSNGQCIDQVNGYQCACSPGWTGDICEHEIEECASDPCVNGGICIDQVNQYQCACQPGFTGVNCESGINYY